MPYQEQSIFDSSFLDPVEEWFALRGEIFVVARFSHTAGARGYLWFKRFESFKAQIHLFPPRTDVIVSRDDLFPLRGIVDDQFIAQSLALIPDPAEAMVLDLIEPPDGEVNRHLWYSDTHTELREILQDLMGKNASVGLYAPWHEADNEKLISALVPLPDGTLKRGAY